MSAGFPANLCQALISKDGDGGGHCTAQPRAWPPADPYSINGLDWLLGGPIRSRGSVGR